MGKVASALFLNKDNKILIYLRDDKPSIPHPNCWVLLGGHLEEGESYLDALKREIKEEIDYEIKEPIFIGELDDGVGNTVYVYKHFIDKEIGELVLTEGQKLGLFDFDEILELENVPKRLKDFLRENKKRIFY